MRRDSEPGMDAETNGITVLTVSRQRGVTSVCFGSASALISVIYAILLCKNCLMVHKMNVLLSN